MYQAQSPEKRHRVLKTNPHEASDRKLTIPDAWRGLL